MKILRRVLWTCILRASPRRAWLTASLMIETALRRPRAFRQAVTLALMHKHLYEYMRDTCEKLDGMARDLRRAPEELPQGADTRSDAAGAQRREQILRFAQDDRATVTSTRPQRYIR